MAALTDRSVLRENRSPSISISETEAQREPFVKVNIHSGRRLAVACSALYSEFARLAGGVTLHA
ncbi:hypothetical protein [Sinorhizobium arboris]|uniref:hypothetical protein n=1 Tax=Sinorhizobium arboris TaxID=76745 RepID=UPI001427A67F|nr:hypothetical protein [Sinorhizobium arboris]